MIEWMVSTIPDNDFWFEQQEAMRIIRDYYLLCPHFDLEEYSKINAHKLFLHFLKTCFMTGTMSGNDPAELDYNKVNYFTLDNTQFDFGQYYNSDWEKLERCSIICIYNIVEDQFIIINN